MFLKVVYIMKNVYSYILVFIIILLLANCGGSNKNRSINKISIVEKENNFILTNDTFTYNVIFTPENSNLQDSIEWKVLNEDIATIDNNGILTALKPGNTVIKVYYENFFDTLSVKIRNISEDYVRLHYKNSQNNYNDIGLLLSDNAVKSNYSSFEIDGENYSIDNPLMLSTGTLNDYGIYIDIPVLPGANNLYISFLERNNLKNEFDILKNISFSSLQNYNEYWIYESSSTLFIEQPDLNNIVNSIRIEKIYDILKPGDTILLTPYLSPSNQNIMETLEWQTSNNEIGTIHRNGIFTAVNPGKTEVLCFANGIGATQYIYVVPEVPSNYNRLYYHQYDENYENIYIELSNNINNEKISYSGQSNFGIFFDIPKYNDNSLLEISVRDTYKIFSTAEIENISNNSEYFLKQGSVSPALNNNMNVGSVKIANSWGIGNGENIGDGFFYMSYDLLKKNKTSVWFLMPDENHLIYEPKAIAVFSIEHPIRDEVKVTIGVGDYDNPEKTKIFRGFMRRQTFASSQIDTLPFENTNIAFDITELLPFENDTVFISVYDKEDSEATGFLNSFSVELYDNYNLDPIEIYNSDTIPIATINTEIIYKSIPDVSSQIIIAASPKYSSSINNTIQIISRETNKNDIEKFNLTSLQNSGSVETSGLRMPDDNDWNRILSENRLKYINNISKLYSSQLPSSYDISVSIHFPPIGDQRRKGSCASWSSGYYMAGYYAAKKFNWNMSNINVYWTAENVSPGNENKLMSADFVYNLVNAGRDDGSFFYDPFKIISDIGISSIQTMPIIAGNVISWPSEEAWREAPKYRVNYDKNQYWFILETDEDIANLKTLLQSGYVVNIAYDALNWRNYSPNDTLTTKNYLTHSLNHGVTVVGYFDDWEVD
jgi:hypothetical protein